jgi:hypothetical protein
MSERDIGRHDEAIGALKEDVAQLRTDVAAIKDLLSEARGGWKSLMWVAGFASAAGAVLVWVVSFVKDLGSIPPPAG